MINLRKPNIIIPLTTLCLGFIPMVVLSLLTDSFWLNSPFDFPLVVIPSVLIGDSLFFPIINYKIFSSLNLVNIKKQKSVILATISLIFSLLINSYSHYLWTQDKYTGFMDMEIGSLSIAGWWHWGYSVIQMFLILYFAFVWINHNTTISDTHYKKFMQTWLIFIGFSSLNLPGFIFKYHFILFTNSLITALRMEITSFIPMLASILLAVAMSATRKYTKARRYS